MSNNLRLAIEVPLPNPYAGAENLLHKAESRMERLAAAYDSTDTPEERQAIGFMIMRADSDIAAIGRHRLTMEGYVAERLAEEASEFLENQPPKISLKGVLNFITGLRNRH